MLYKLGRGLQVVGMILLPVGMVGNILQPEKVTVQESSDHRRCRRGGFCRRLAAAAGGPAARINPLGGQVAARYNLGSVVGNRERRMAMGRGQVWAGTAAAAWLAISVHAAEPPKLAGESPRTTQRFAEAAELESQQKWSDAVEVYLRLIDDAGDDLVSADGDNRYLLPARRLAHRRIAARSELLAIYRARVEPRAKRLLEQGESERDPQVLGQVVDQFFGSRSAETALNLLGDLACERGEFDRARQYWRRLALSGSSGDLAYPDPTGGPALARAKCILSRLLAGERAEAVTEFQAFRKEHARADRASRRPGRQSGSDPAKPD